MAEKMLSLIIPVYYEEEVLLESYRRMDAAMRSTGHPYEIIYVNDGSRDGTMRELRQLAKAHPDTVKVYSFSRNFGHQLAVTCGMDHAKGDALIIIDVDLQDSPELIPKMVEMWKDGADIVYGKRLKRKGETVFKKLTAKLYYRLLSWMSAYPIPLDTGDFRLLDRKVANVFLKMREQARFLRGMSAWMGFEAVPIEYVREERAAGKTKYTLKKMLKLACAAVRHRRRARRARHARAGCDDRFDRDLRNGVPAVAVGCCGRRAAVCAAVRIHGRLRHVSRQNVRRTQRASAVHRRRRTEHGRIRRKWNETNPCVDHRDFSYSRNAAVTVRGPRTARMPSSQSFENGSASGA